MCGGGGGGLRGCGSGEAIGSESYCLTVRCHPTDCEMTGHAKEVWSFRMKSYFSTVLCQPTDSETTGFVRELKRLCVGGGGGRGAREGDPLHRGRMPECGISAEW